MLESREICESDNDMKQHKSEVNFLHALVKISSQNISEVLFMKDAI